MSNGISVKGGGLVSRKILLCLRLPMILINFMGNNCSLKSMCQERKKGEDVMLEILKKPLSRIVGTTIAVAGVTLLTCTMGNGIAKAEGPTFQDVASDR